MYKLFQNNIKQLNIGDSQGTLFNSFNIDLSYNKGKLSVSPRTRITTNTITDFGTPTGFVYFDGYWWTTSGLYVWKAVTPQSPFVKDASTGGTYLPPTDCDSRYSHLTVFNDQLIVSTQSRIYRKAANGAGTGGWDVIDTGLAAAIVRPVCTYLGRLYWTRTDNTIVSCDEAYTIAVIASGNFNLDLPNNYKVTFLKTYTAGLYIGTITFDGTQGVVFAWNGSNQKEAQSAYNIYAQGALSCYVDNTFFYIINSNAELLQFNGGAFTQVSRLPVKRESLYNANATGSSGNNRFIHPDGMCLIDGFLCMLINGRTNSMTQQENIASGIWEFLPETNTLYHKYSMSYNTIAGTQTDNGQVILNIVGGLANTSDLLSYSDVQRGNFLAGASFYSDATTVGYGAFTDNYFDNEQKAGFFSTVQLRTERFEDMFQRITTLYTPTTGMQIVWKYRTVQTDHTDFTITWTSANTFTTTQVGIVAGDEITIIQGKGSGRIAHVLGTPTFSTPNFTVTLDESIINVTGTAKARVQKWKKIGTINNINQFYDTVGIGQPGTLIELKAAIVATGETTIDEVILENKLNK